MFHGNKFHIFLADVAPVAHTFPFKTECSVSPKSSFLDDSGSTIYSFIACWVLPITDNHSWLDIWLSTTFQKEVIIPPGSRAPLLPFFIQCKFFMNALPHLPCSWKELCKLLSWAQAHNLQISSPSIYIHI